LVIKGLQAFNNSFSEFSLQLFAGLKSDFGSAKER
jgi:hypothetical protein